MRLSILVCALTLGLFCQAASPFAGRWDFVVRSANESYPGWMEFIEAPQGPHIRVQPRTGNVVPAQDVVLQGSHLNFSFGRGLSWDLTSSQGRLTGTQKTGNETATLNGVRAPALKRDPPKSWTAPEALFNGKNLDGWVPMQPEANHWIAQDGVLLNQERGSNLQTTRKFGDFKLHIELDCPEGGNSGIYLRGRYEIQVAYEKDPNPYFAMGAIYGFLKPWVKLPRKPGQWESFDATLIGRRLTLLRDGVTLFDQEEIPGITGGALDSDEAAPGPFYIQGDHTGGMRYRNITISVAR